MPALTLGLGGSDHDFSAALLEDGQIRFAIEDERVQRVKHARAEWHAEPARDAAMYCLDAAGVDIGDLSGIFCCDDLDRPTGWLDWTDVTMVNHHTCHAAASFYTSPHERAALLVVDGHGSVVRETSGGYELETISTGWADSASFSLQPLQTGGQARNSNAWRYVTHNSIGWFYEIVTEGLGFGGTGQGKAMGLAAYGSPKHLEAMSEFVEISPDGRFRFDPYGGIWTWLRDTLAGRSNAMQIRADLAYAAQEIFVRAIITAAREAHRLAPSPVLCFGGGCGLNTLANSRILEETPFEHLAVFPASGDNGLSVGAALYGTHVVQGLPRSPLAAGWRGRAAYTGREYGADEVDAVLTDAPVATSSAADLAQDAARALADGEVVAVCRGRSEIGPRALGNRSLLALPGSARMRDHINLNIKQRESFRPLAPVVPLEYVAHYFEGIEESPFMLLVATVREEARDRLGAVTHSDGTARVQTVRSEDNPFLHRLLHLVGEETGVPVLLNTSLNLRGEPIVETPADALRLFLRRPVDALVLGDRLIRKHTPWTSPSTLPGWRDNSRGTRG